MKVVVAKMLFEDMGSDTNSTTLKRSFSDLAFNDHPLRNNRTTITTTNTDRNVR